jgi:hypothetical protein
MYRVTNLGQRRLEMNEELFQRLFILLRRPIPWDPIPWWIKLDKERERQFNDVQVTLNTKMAQIQNEKILELTKIANIPIK